MMLNTIFVLFITITQLSGIYTMGETSPGESQSGKMNVVLFFTNGDPPIKSAHGANYLGMEEKARVKLSANVPKNVNPYIAQRQIPNCKESLREGIQSLVHFCQNGLGMKTAVASVSVHEITKDISAHEMDVPHEIRTREAVRGSARYKWRTNDNRRSLRHIQKSHLKNIVTSPEHKEIFKIRLKRGTNTMYQPQRHPIRDVELGKSKDRPSWDILDVMQHVRYSFLGKLFENELQKNELINGSPDRPLDRMKISKIDPGLFETVKSTLASLQETPDPFLMVIFGGHLSEIGDCHSAVVQSLKHITEMTDPGNTLIVLTASCPEPSDSPEVHENAVRIEENPHLRQQLCEDYPIFAKGPKSEKLGGVTQLHDLPLAIKGILEEIHPNFGGNAESPSDREKRSIFYDIPERKRSNDADFMKIHYFLIVTLLSSFLLT